MVKESSGLGKTSWKVACMRMELEFVHIRFIFHYQMFFCSVFYTLKMSNSFLIIKKFNISFRGGGSFFKVGFPIMRLFLFVCSPVLLILLYKKVASGALKLLLLVLTLEVDNIPPSILSLR